ncbi:hypothetical protein MnTg02_01645 [bacterium MnTg02]|nr:hypothetical protein MnTg02_01645 [bacterium MnTg02]
MGENGGAVIAVPGLLHQRRQSAAVEDIVAQDQRRAFTIDEIGPDDIGLCQAFRLGLNGIRELQPQLVAVAQQLLILPKRFRRGDDQNISNACQHQCGQRIVDHRFIVNGEHLLRYDRGHGMKPRSCAPCKDDPLHKRANPLSVNLGIERSLCPKPVNRCNRDPRKLSWDGKHVPAIAKFAGRGRWLGLLNAASVEQARIALMWCQFAEASICLEHSLQRFSEAHY